METFNLVLGIVNLVALFFLFVAYSLHLQDIDDDRIRQWIKNNDANRELKQKVKNIHNYLKIEEHQVAASTELRKVGKKNG